MSKDKKKLTTTAGCPVAHNQNVMTAGPRGPQLLQDVLSDVRAIGIGAQLTTPDPHTTA